MDEKELQEFLKMVTPMLKELSEDEIRNQLNEIDMTGDEKEKFLNIIMILKEDENKQ